MKRALAIILLATMFWGCVAYGEEKNYRTYEYGGISFEYNSEYLLDEIDENITISFDKGKTLINIINSNLGSIADVFFEISISAYIGKLDVQDLKQGEIKAGSIPGKFATGYLKKNGSFTTLMVVSLLDKETVYTFAYFGDQSVEDEVFEAQKQEFVHLIDSIKPILLSDEKIEKLAVEHKEKLSKSLSITKIATGKPNFVDGVTLTISWSNKSSDEIKYIKFYVTPINSVDDEVECDVTGNSTICLELTGPFKKGKKFNSKFEDAWYNNTIKKARLDKVEIEYMDGDTLTIVGEYFDYKWMGK